jgi:hypothetical protein
MLGCLCDPKREQRFDRWGERQCRCSAPPLPRLRRQLPFYASRPQPARKQLLDELTKTGFPGSREAYRKGGGIDEVKRIILMGGLILLRT